MSAEPAFDADLAAAVLAWYDRRGRNLPFRRTTDPYAILVSETMAQQTQIRRVAESWTSFIEHFPSFEVLAAATPADVLRAWQGLGYNRRALNLWRTARIVVDQHDGRLPREVDALERLPGIGPYTARAVAALAHGVRVGAVDTNVRRALGRIVAGSPDALRPQLLQAHADAAVPADRPADWNHALMDLGATLCRPREPRCEACPALARCRYASSAATGTAPADRPSRATRKQTGPPFPMTTRWLRGRLLDQLRAAPDGEWLELGGRLGDHSPSAIRAALAALANEGLVELAVASQTRARLPFEDRLPPGPPVGMAEDDRSA